MAPFEDDSGDAARESLIHFQNSILGAVAFGREASEIIGQACLFCEEMVPGSIASVMLTDEHGQLRPHFPAAEAPVPGSSWYKPIFAEKKIIGAFALSGIERTASPFEEKLMEVTASIASIVLERKRQNEALSASREKFRLLFEEATDGKMLLSEEGRILDVNRIGHTRLGYAKEEMVGRPASDFVTPENAGKVIQRLRRVREEGHATYASAQVRKDGSVMPIEISTIVIELDGRETYYSILRDITKRKAAEHALIKSEARIRNIQEHAPIGLACVSLDGRFMDVNQSLCRIVGYEKEELEALTFQEITYPEDLEADLDNAKRLLSGEIAQYKMEKRYIRKGGEIVWIQLTGSLLRDIDGSPLHFIAQIEDISDRKIIERRLQHLAYHDLLTDLPNRLFLVEKLEWALVQARRHERSLAVMFLDLDQFKLVNDTLGHDVGDKLLKVVASRLTSCVRKGDIVARQGGDEFIIVLTEVSRPEDARLVAEKIIESVGLPMDIDPHRLKIGTSIGIAVYPVDGEDDARELMKKADQAMYGAKESGRNGYRFFGE